ncbi:electron transfer flavoprotein subunit beta/FixA family protein [bacterium]|nr:electron transfer flavoprotein subunit beta/FixA family protein [bacterium]
MKIAVVVKQTPDTETKANLGAAGLETNGVKFILNPYDEFAVEEAINVRDKVKGEATVISLGPDRVIDAMRTALAMGCDNAIHVKVSEEDLAKCDSYVVAKGLAEAIKQKGPFDLVFAGKQAIDDDALAVPQMLAAFLDWPRATVVTKLEVNAEAKTAKANRAIEAGAEEVIELQLPAIIAANKGLNTPRYASLPGIMKAKKKPVDVLELSALGTGPQDSKVEMGGFELPPEKQAGKIFKGSAEELAKQIASALRNEAKVL